MKGLPVVHLAMDELEAMRLCDVDDLDQTSAGERMGVSRGTVQRLLRRGRTKVLTALLQSSALLIDAAPHREHPHPPGDDRSDHEDA
jgi:predicted DNA-binding protein (UPF0251 family)